MEWHALMTKLFKSNSLNLHAVKKQTSNEINGYFKSKNYQKNDEGSFRVHVIGEESSIGHCIDNTNDIYQSSLLDLNEFVYHNSLCTELPVVQHERISSKIRHCNGQLRKVVSDNSKKRIILQSFLSEMVISVSTDARQTANVLNLQNGILSRSFHLCSRPRDVSMSYFTSCSMKNINKRCQIQAIPYTKYCINHISNDIDQCLFLSNGILDTGSIIHHFLYDESGESSSLMTNDLKKNVSSLTKNNWKSGLQSKRSSQKLKPCNERKRLGKRKIKSKRKRNKKMLDLTRDEFQETSNTLKDRSHSTNIHVKKCIQGKSTKLLGNQFKEKLNTSNSDEYDTDMLTPEEAFHLSPGSISFSPHMVDDDTMPRIQRRTCDLDEDDDELIRCTGSFSYEHKLNRDIGSPTLNQLSSTDFVSSLNNFNDDFISPAITLSSTRSIVRPMAFSSNLPISNDSKKKSNGNSSRSTFLSEINCSNALKAGCTVDKSDQNNLHLPKQHLSHNLEADSSFDSLSGCVRDESAMMKYHRNRRRLMNDQQSTTRCQESNSLTNTVINHPQNVSLKDAIVYDNTSITKHYLSDPMLLQQPISTNNTFFDNINSDIESPLEKVNPDIFFSSVYPVTSVADKL